MNKNELPVMINAKTGGVFHQIGLAHGVKCGFRVWLQPPAKSSSSALNVGFRIRLEPEHPLPEGEVFKLQCVKLFPEAKWTGLSLNHVSMAGEIMVRVPFWLKEQALEALNKNDIGGRVADYLNKALPGFNFDREEFADYFLDVLNADYSGAVDTTDCDGLVLFAPCEGENHIYKDGYEVTTVVTPPPITDIAKPPKVEVVKKPIPDSDYKVMAQMAAESKHLKTVAETTEKVANKMKEAGVPEDVVATYKKVFGIKKAKTSAEQALGAVPYHTVTVPMQDSTGPAAGSLEPEGTPSLSPEGEN